MTTIAFGIPGPTELAFIALILIILFGANQLPKWARALGQTRKELRKATEELTELTKDDDKA